MSRLDRNVRPDSSGPYFNVGVTIDAYTAAKPGSIRTIVNELSANAHRISSTTVRSQLPVEDVADHLLDCGICLLYFYTSCRMRRLEYPKDFIGKTLLD